MRPRIGLWLLGFSLGLTVINGGRYGGAIAQSVPFTVAALPPLIQWCQDRAQWPEVTQRMVDRLLLVTKTAVCDRGNRDFSQRTELDLTLEFRYIAVTEPEQLQSEQLSDLGDLGICKFSNGDSPYGCPLSRLWKTGSRLQENRQFVAAQKVYQQALITAQMLVDKRLRICAIAHSQVELDIVTAIEQYLRKHPDNPDPTEGIEIIRIQQNYASWETVGRQFKLSAKDCP